MYDMRYTLLLFIRYIFLIVIINKYNVQAFCTPEKVY